MAYDVELYFSSIAVLSNYLEELFGDLKKTWGYNFNKLYPLLASLLLAWVVAKEQVTCLHTLMMKDVHIQQFQDYINRIPASLAASKIKSTQPRRSDRFMCVLFIPLFHLKRDSAVVKKKSNQPSLCSILLSEISSLATINASQSKFSQTLSIS